MPRPKIDEVFLDVAQRFAQHGTCLRRNFGAVLVDDSRHIVSTGYSGAPCHEKDCLQIGKCWRVEHNIPSQSNYEKCRSVHAEMNALLQAGKRAEGCTLYLCGVIRCDAAEAWMPVFRWPCFLCSKMLLNAGVSGVVIRLPTDKSWQSADMPEGIETWDSDSRLTVDVELLYRWHEGKVLNG
jgi:dCMP deaminase